MRFFITSKIYFSTIACLFLFSGILYSQAYRFKNYGIDNGLPSNVVYTLTQDNNGYLWVGTTEGLSRFDGFDFYKVTFPDSTNGRYPTASIKDNKGTLWFGCSDGTVFYSQGSTLKQVPLTNSSTISCLLEGPDGLIYAIPQRKLVFSINPVKPDEVHPYSISSDPVMSSASFSHSGNLLIGTQENLLICEVKADSIKTLKVIEGFDYSRIISIHQMNDSTRFIIGTDGNGLFQLQLTPDNSILSRFTGYPELETLTVRAITEDSEKNLWISTSETGAVRLTLNSKDETLQSVRFLNKTSGLPGDNVTLVFRDLEDNYWIGFNGAGLSMLSSDAFSFYAPGENGNPNNIIYINKLNSDYFLGTPTGFYVYDLSGARPVSFTNLTRQAGRNEISAYHIDSKNNVWIGTKGSGLFLKNSTGNISQFFRSGDTGADYITNIEMDDENIWLATLNGVNIISRKSGALLKNYNINNGLPHNSINQIFLTADGSAYVATESDRLYRIDVDSGIIVSDAVMYGILLNKILAVTQGRDGVIWAATQGNGVFECYRDSVKEITVTNGLLSNYTYSILSDSENNIWIGHQRGFSRYNPMTGVTKIYGTDFARGGSCNTDGMYESPDGKIFIGTTEGLIIYDRLKDKKKQVAPFNNINSITINEVNYPYQPSFSLPYKKRYAVRVNYSGINFSDPEKVYYSTYLENYDDDWTKVSSSREVKYSLRDGKYNFNLISVNEDGLSQENPVSFQIIIKRPIWREWWFILSLIGIVSGIVVLIVREREKVLKKREEYLETELEARTQVVRKQKAEIELQNHEITDSINYARRIQSSILPDTSKLREQFKDAFIMLYPRDIVSGDFFWFDKLDNDMFVLVCADSTGHGVPGAFMSMIGTTLLRDIVTRQKISRPSEILTLLDKQIFSTLNQKLDVGVSNDGMDVVVCEFTLKNRHIRFASAMRTVILVLGGETYYIKGNRSSVGGESVMEKYFDDQEYYLNEGDTLYMFSDGLPDQFGGPDGKKMKIARLKRLIGEVSKLPMDQQEEAVAKFYYDWKGKHDQVDDILFMGVRV
jgi:ligand-binding sensor domain-containing protein/serine phosphatase RsbU (regulator of sigma subunit)